MIGRALPRVPRIGSLFSGYGGLDQGVSLALGGGDVVWHSDIDKGANKILAHRYPTIPNLGDLTKIDWSSVPPIDVLTGGFPCQDLSHAGKRAGMKPGTRSGLWAHMAYAIAQLRPRLVVAENVRGLLSAEANSDMEPCPWCLGDDGDVHALRALGAVLGDLAELGYDARWYGLRAADVGAPHGRFRVFVVAYPRDGAAVDPGDDAGEAPAGRRPGQVAGLAEPAGDGGPSVEPDVQGRPGAAADAHAERPELPVPGVGGPPEPDGVHRPRLRVVGGAGPGADAEGGNGGLEPAHGRLSPQPGGVAAGAGEAAGGDAGAAGRDAAVPDAGGERHGRGEDPRGVGRVERGGDDASPDARPAAVDRGPGPGPDGEPERVAACGAGPGQRCSCHVDPQLCRDINDDTEFCWYCGRPELVDDDECGNCGAPAESPLIPPAPAEPGRLLGDEGSERGPGGEEGRGARPEPGGRDREGRGGQPPVDPEGVEQREPMLGVVQQPGDGPEERGGPGAEVAWGRYGPAIRRWERVLGRPAPAPTEVAEKGGHRLSPRFVEWMMGLDEGHVTGVPDMSRAEMLKALGNGVVPQQAAAAVRDMLGIVS